MIFHMRAVHAEKGDAGWILFLPVNKILSKKIVKILVDMPEDYCSSLGKRSWWVTMDGEEHVRDVVEWCAPENSGFCADCVDGEDCDFWWSRRMKEPWVNYRERDPKDSEDAASFDEEIREQADKAAHNVINDFLNGAFRQPHLEGAAHTLGVTWPCTKDQVTDAFRAAALRCHPDRGGSNEAMVAVTKARDTLLAAM